MIDAYCGVGTIGFAFADKVKSVRGMDIIPEAIEDAKYNAKQMGFDNTHYELGRLRKLFLVGTRKAIGQMQSLWIHHGLDWGCN